MKTRVLSFLGMLALALPLLVIAPDAWADEMGSVTGGSRGSQSALAGCTYIASPSTLTDGQQAALNCATDHSLKVSATITPSGTQDVNITKVGGNAVTTTVPVSGTVTANGGGTAGTANAGVLSVQGIASMTPVQVSQATAANLKAEVVGTGTFVTQSTLAAETTKVIGTVNIAAAQSIAATQSGTWTVQPGNTANTTPWLVALQPTTSGGSSTFSANVTTAGSGAGTGGVAVDVSAGQLYGYAVYNGNASVCYMSFFDQTQALTNLGTTVPKLAIGIPANGGANIAFPNGIPFATAITVSATTTRNGSTACSTGLDINVMFK